MSAHAKVWRMGSTWTAHARHEDTGAWIRVTGIDTEHEAVVEADALVHKLNREARSATEGPEGAKA